MSFQLLHLCQRTDAEYTLLQQRTDACAQLGRSYELPCTLPSYCVPCEATVGFCRTGNRYFLYLRPRVQCNGTLPTLSGLLLRGMESFPTFSDLTAWLRRLGRELSGGTPTAPPFYDRLHGALSQRVLGQAEAVEATAFRIATHLCKSHPLRPLSLVLYGPTGVGKSELGKAIAPVLRCIQPQHNWDCVWTELNTFTQPHSLYRLIGAPPGYVGYDDRPILDAVRRNPYTVFLFDELDKAHPEILKVFMSILDEGRCSAHCEDEQGQRELNFRHCILIFTTNADLTGTSRRPLGFCSPCECTTPPETTSTDTDLAHRLFALDEVARRAMVQSGVLCEIATRFTGLIGFKPLDHSARHAITAQQITALGQEFGLQILSVSPAIVDALTPQNALSVRATTAMLEGTLTPLFAAHSAQNHATPLQLCGSLHDMTLRTVGAHL